MVHGYEAKTGMLLRAFKGHPGGVNCLKAANNRLYSGSFDGTLRVWTTDEIKDSENPWRFPRQGGTGDAGEIMEHPDDQVIDRQNCA
jgi:WD40 repeat protein